MRLIRIPMIVVLCLAAVSFAQSGAQSIPGNVKMRQIAIIEMPGRPGYDAAAFANGMLLMAHSAANTVDIFDPVKRRLVAQVQGIGEPRGIVVDPQTGLAYIAARSTNSITVLNTKDWSVAGVIGLKRAPENIALIPTAKSLLVSNPLNASVSVVSIESLGKKDAELATIDLGGRPQQIAWDPTQHVAYIAIEDRSEIAVVDPQNGSAPLMKRFKVEASQPTGLAFDPGTRRLFVAVRYAVLQMDPDSGAEVARAPAAAGTDTLWFDDANKRLYAAAGDGSVHIFRVNGNITSENEFRAEVRGHSIAYDPTTKMMYLSGGREGKSKVLILKEAGTAPAGEAQTAENR
jgi:DNA-binding beta-propeller fold protein YncE